MEYVYLVAGVWNYKGISLKSIEIFHNKEKAEKYADELRKKFIYDSVTVAKKEIL